MIRFTLFDDTPIFVKTKKTHYTKHTGSNHLSDGLKAVLFLHDDKRATIYAC
ncbi:hypothetical protein JOC74_002369 [Bacillus capparidis]|uniref:Uncharacterized protein n=1 Tax=Bacillus capparidis TaxID=1840411 RepID=A0ABS4CWE4_9BACI|nr:hypothetical protein [Bacillus capparidis]